MLSQLVPLTDLGVVVSPRDNVAVAKRALEKGLVTESPRGERLVLSGPVTPGNRFALRAIPAGELVLQYGEPIGTSRGIAAGEPVTKENMGNEVPVIRDVDEHQALPATPLVAPDRRARFQGYVRPDGRVGTRNWLLIVPTSMCASHESTQIAMRAEMTLWNEQLYPTVDGIVAIPHNRGCGCPEGSDVETVLRTLAAYADHPNVGGVVFLHLGCEKTNSSMLAKYIQSQGGLSWKKPTAWVGIQESGGTRAAIDAGLKAVASILPAVAEARRSSCSVEHLVLGVECGGSDGFSGLSANPALGNAGDRLVMHGGAVILSEVPEFCGAEHLLARRAKDAATAREVYALVDWYKQHAGSYGAKLDENPSPGNVAGGLLNITIKSLGAIAKGGTTRVEGTIGYAERIRGKGLHLMQGPGYDQESVPGLVASGANVVVFTTGRGTTIGNAIVPVIKLATNTPIFERMSADLDLNAGTIIDGTETHDQVGARVFERIRAVAGKELLARAEENLHREFQIWAPQPLSL
jgi:altronate hydrolase